MREKVLRYKGTNLAKTQNNEYHWPSADSYITPSYPETPNKNVIVFKIPIKRECDRFYVAILDFYRPIHSTVLLTQCLIISKNLSNH
nr:unnamed protein product [Haemonchus contortus]